MIERIVRALALPLAFLAFAAVLAPAAVAQPQQAQFIYVDPPIASDTPGKIEVVEFFWYECPHCYELEPYLEKWVPKLAKDVQFKRVPATFNERWRTGARIFYALESLGIENKLHRPLMDAIHKDRIRFVEPPGGRQGAGGGAPAGGGWTVGPQTTDWLKKQGVDVAKFQAATTSFAVESRLRRADEILRHLGPRLDGVPALMIDGRYLVVAQSSAERMLATADALINEARKTAAPAPAKPAAKK